MPSHCIIILLIFNFCVFLPGNIKAIISGLDGEIEQFPYLASIQAQGELACAAAIVSERHLITVAHCMNYSTGEYSVRVGSRYWSKDGLYIKSIESVIIHPKYDKESDDYDFAVVILKEPLTFSPTINRVALPAKGENVKSGEGATVAGWGSTNRPDRTMVSPNFKFATLSTLTREDCIPLVPEGTIITERNICARDPSQKEDTCFGDGGGPLVVKGFLVGLVSWGFECAIGYPGVYSSVSEAIDFLEEVQNNSN